MLVKSGTGRARVPSPSMRLDNIQSDDVRERPIHFAQNESGDCDLVYGKQALGGCKRQEMTQRGF